VMLSYASDGGGVGPHLDSYDVFLLQVHGRRRWSIGPVDDERLVESLPVKILADFKPTDTWDLEPGDMLYLPPRWGHDGVAVGECMTCSIGFKAPDRGSLAAGLLSGLAESLAQDQRLYRDARQRATSSPGRIPPTLQSFAASAVKAALDQPGALEQALGEWLTEPKPRVWFDGGEAWQPGAGVRLDRRSRMMVDDHHVYLNGESFRAGGADAVWMATLADRRVLVAGELRHLSRAARRLVADWVSCGWLIQMAP
jgi:50S ribosomal protein L16 3-hydroxylase